MRHPQYTSLYTRRESLEWFVEKGGRLALALLDNDTIIGFAVLDYPDSEERWAKLGQESVMEVKAVEVLRHFRHQGIASHLLAALLSDLDLDKKIVYLTAYSWTWDLGYLGMTVEAYQKMLLSLYGHFGFIEYPTNEPNVCLKPENMFMARVGKNVNEKMLEKFQWVRFGIPF